VDHTIFHPVYAADQPPLAFLDVSAHDEQSVQIDSRSCQVGQHRRDRPFRANLDEHAQLGLVVFQRDDFNIEFVSRANLEFTHERVLQAQSLAY
jgi:hypothetical protein